MESYITSVDFYKGVTIIRLSGTITLESLSSAQAEWRAKMKGRAVKNILFDLERVTETDTSGIAALIDLLKYMKSHQTGDKIGLTNVSSKAKDLLAISKTEPLFSVYPSEEGAIADLQ